MFQCHLCSSMSKKIQIVHLFWHIFIPFYSFPAVLSKLPTYALYLENFIDSPPSENDSDLVISDLRHISDKTYSVFELTIQFDPPRAPTLSSFDLDVLLRKCWRGDARAWLYLLSTDMPPVILIPCSETHFDNVRKRVFI